MSNEPEFACPVCGTRAENHPTAGAALDVAATRIEELTRDRAVAEEHHVSAARERDAAIAQLALARPIAEALVDWCNYEGLCRLCGCCLGQAYSPDNEPHAADCPVPAWIAGRK